MSGTGKTGIWLTAIRYLTWSGLGVWMCGYQSCSGDKKVNKFVGIISMVGCFILLFDIGL